MRHDDEDFIFQNIDIFSCPNCGSDLAFKNNTFHCLDCERLFQVFDGIPSLFWPNQWESSKEDVTEKIKSFYEQTPFPNYDEFENVGSLLEKARKSLFRQIIG